VGDSPFLFRAIPKQRTINGSRLGRYARAGQPPGSGGVGPGPSFDKSGQLDRKYLFSGKSYEKIVQKKIPEIAIDQSNCPEEKSVLDKVDKRYSISGISYEKSVQKKDPGNRDSFVQLVQIPRMS